MARRYIGDARIVVTYHDDGDYRGVISANGHAWHFRDLKAPPIGHGNGVSYDSPEAYDSMAASAVSFGSYYSSHNRGDDLPEWAPPAEVADAIQEATQFDTDEDGQGLYFVKRTEKGPGRWTP